MLNLNPTQLPLGCANEKFPIVEFIDVMFKFPVFMLPVTSKVALGTVFPMPTFPELVAR